MVTHEMITFLVTWNLGDPSRRHVGDVRECTCTRVGTVVWVVPACDLKDRFSERQPRKTAQVMGLIWVGLVQ